MLCTKCGKNEATVYFSQTINGNKTEQHLCAECAKTSGIADSFNRHRKYVQSRLLAPFGNFGFSNAFESLGFSDTFFDHDYLLPVDTAPEVCPYCGKTAEDFTKTGKLGCSMCYEVFHDKIDLTRSKNSSAPKKPEAATYKLSHLRAELDKAIKSERYEDAARFRDEIKALEKE